MSVAAATKPKLQLDVEPTPAPAQHKQKSKGLLGLMGLEIPSENSPPAEAQRQLAKWQEKEAAYQGKTSSGTALPPTANGNATKPTVLTKTTKQTQQPANKTNKTRLSVDSSDKADMKESVIVTADGTLKIKSVEIRPTSSQYLEALGSENLVTLRPLGAGASGSVVQALHSPSLTVLALKSIDVSDKAKRDQLVRELTQLDSTNSPFIVSFYGAFFDNGTTKLALEYMNRGSLQSVCKDFGTLSEEVLSNCTRQILFGLKHLHDRNKVHRDIKPGNILINHRGQVKLSDFGILAELSSSVENCHTFVGTTVYMSPERIKDSNYSFPADIWSLGMTIITCLTGKFPLKTDQGYFGIVHQVTENPPPQLPAEFSADVRDFVNSCLQKDPKKRGTAAQLLEHKWIVNGIQGDAVLPYWPKAMNMYDPNAPVDVDAVNKIRRKRDKSKSSKDKDKKKKEKDNKETKDKDKDKKKKDGTGTLKRQSSDVTPSSAAANGTAAAAAAHTNAATATPNATNPPSNASSNGSVASLTGAMSKLSVSTSSPKVTPAARLSAAPPPSVSVPSAAVVASAAVPVPTPVTNGKKPTISIPVATPAPATTTTPAPKVPPLAVPTAASSSSSIISSGRPKLNLSTEEAPPPVLTLPGKKPSLGLHVASDEPVLTLPGKKPALGLHVADDMSVESPTAPQITTVPFTEDDDDDESPSKAAESDTGDHKQRRPKEKGDLSDKELEQLKKVLNVLIFRFQHPELELVDPDLAPSFSLSDGLGPSAGNAAQRDSESSQSPETTDNTDLAHGGMSPSGSMHMDSQSFSLSLSVRFLNMRSLRPQGRPSLNAGSGGPRPSLDAERRTLVNEPMSPDNESAKRDSIGGASKQSMTMNIKELRAQQAKMMLEERERLATGKGDRHVQQHESKAQPPSASATAGGHPNEVKAATMDSFSLMKKRLESLADQLGFPFVPVFREFNHMLLQRSMVTPKSTS